MESTHETLFTFRGDWDARVVATAIHAGHDLRPEVADLMVLEEADRLREEDPFTDELGAGVPDQVVVHRSRFEVDLNRGPEDAVYATPEQSWGMQVWRDETLPADVVERSLAEREQFYAALAERLDPIAARGPFVVLDVHSYNHRRHGADADPEPAEDNPVVNVGTGSMDRDRWGDLVDLFNETMAQATILGEPLDVRENVKFKGAELCRWVHERYPETGCALAIEFKKVYMDEWTGEPDREVIADLAGALGRTAAKLDEALAARGQQPAAPVRGSNPLSAGDRAIDHEIAQISTSFQFLAALTPNNVPEAKAAFLETGRVPDFSYAELEVDPDVLEAQLQRIDPAAVEDPMVHQLLARKHRELELQVEMLRARDSEDFLPLSIELYGSISPRVRQRAEAMLEWVPDKPEQRSYVDAGQFLALAQAEVDHYRGIDDSLTMHAEIGEHAAVVMVQGDTLVIPPGTHVESRRANALIQHEVGTHLVTRANGIVQPLKVLGAGLAGYDETQEGLAVLAEIACGGLTAGRLRTLAARVVTVHRMAGGAGFVECFNHLVDAGLSRGTAFTTTMRAFRSGGFTKDAVYLRGLVDLLDHVKGGGDLGLLWLGKFSLADLPLVEDLWHRGVLNEPRVCPRWLDDPQAQARIARAAEADSLIHIFQEAETPMKGTSS